MATATAAPAAAPARRPLIYYGYWIVSAAFVAQFVAVGTQAQVAGVFLKPMTEDLDWARGEFTIAQSAGRFIMAFTSFFIGAYVDRFGGRALMVIGVTILGVSLFLTSEVTELWQWIVLRGVFFMVGAAMMGNLVVNVTISKWFVEKRGRVVGVAAMGVSFAGIVMPPLMTGFVDEFGWRAGWRVLAVGAWLLIYPVSMIMRRRPEDYGLHPDGKSDEEVRAGGGEAAAADLANSFTRREALRTRTLYVVILAFGLGGVGIGAMLSGSIPFLTDAGFSRTTAALMMSTMSFPALVSKPVWGWLMDIVQPKVLAAIGFVLSGIAMLVILAGANAGSLPVLIGGFLLIGLGFGGQIPLQEVIWASYFGRRYLGAVRSVAMPFALGLAAGGPLIVQLYFDRVGNYDGVFTAIALLWVLAALLILMVRRPVKPGAPGAPAVGPPENDGASLRNPAALESGAAARGDGDGVAAGEPEGETVAVAPRVPPRDYMAAR